MPSRQADSPSPMLGCLGALIVAALIAGAIGYFTSYRAVDTQTVALIYGGGPLDPDVGKFKRAVGPGGRHNIGLANRVYGYPATNRTYIISAAEGEGDQAGVDSVPVSTADTNTTVNVQGTAYFRLNLAPETLRAFHERYGLKYRAWEGADSTNPADGWARMLKELFRNPLQSAITTAGRSMTVSDFSDGAKVAEFEQRVGTELTSRLETTLGGKFFCGPAVSKDPRAEDCAPLTFSMKPYQPPAEVAAANQRIEIANRSLEAARVEAQAIREAQNAGLTGMAYVVNEMRKEGKLPEVIVVPDGTDVAVPAGAGAQQ